MFIVTSLEPVVVQVEPTVAVGAVVLLWAVFEVWSLTQLYSGGFSQSRTNVKKIVFPISQSRIVGWF